jgi:hypothetical protein
VNGDGKVDISDLALLSHYLIGMIKSLPNPLGADANADGKIDAFDSNTIAKMLLGTNLPTNIEEYNRIVGK